MTDNSRQIHIVGAGIAGLAAAIFAIRDGKVSGRDIHIYEEGRDQDAQHGANATGGALDATQVANKGFVMRGERMFEEKYFCTYDLLSGIPSYDDKSISAAEDIFRFTKEAGWRATARLLDVNRGVLNVRSMGFDWGDRFALLRLLLTRDEKKLSRKRIDEVLPDHFFDSHFWQMWCTMFSFQPWHSAIEMRRYLLRFIHLFPDISYLSKVYHTRYDQFHSIVVPIIDWLTAQGVDFQKGVAVVDMEFGEPKAGGQYRVASLTRRSSDDASSHVVALGDKDVVLVTNGSMTDAATLGDWDSPAPLNAEVSGAWTLWRRLAEKRKGAFGDPEAFIRQVERSKWLSFTVVTKSSKFPDHLFRLTGRTFGREGLITFKRSSWFMTIHPIFAPVYPGHDGAKEFIWWGYGLRPNNTGDFIAKKMADCSGKELLEETLRQLRVDDATFAEVMDPKNTTSISCMMPYITSQFMPRDPGDRPPVRPAGAENLAFLGQFAEIEKDVVFTVEYSVRTAKAAIKSLIDSGIEVPPMYEGYRNLRELAAAGWISVRPSWWPFS
jgi:oleate hydratase